MRINSMLLLLCACSGAPRSATAVAKDTDRDPDGPHQAAVTAQVQPLVNGELIAGMVVGLYDVGKLEIYGFGQGPDGKPPTGRTLFELGWVTQAYTSLLLADAVQRREVALDSPVSDLLPPGVTAPTKDKLPITLRELAVHSSGLPELPPSVRPEPDPFAKYGENQLYQDLVRTQLATPPGARILFSAFGSGVLGHVLGRKIGTAYATALEKRVLGPLALTDTFIRTPPAAVQGRRATGTNDDLAKVAPWTFDALAGAGALISTARDQLAFIAAELDAAAGSRGVLRPAMRLTQETQLEKSGENEGLGWQIDAEGRYWHGGTTGGFRSFIGFDPKTRRGVVILVSTNNSLVDQLPGRLYKVLANEAVKPLALPDPRQLAAYAGSYDFQGMKLTITVSGKRLYVEGPGEPKIRMLPISEHEFWIERLQSVAVFEREGDKVKRAVFIVGNKQLAAPKLD